MTTGNGNCNSHGEFETLDCDDVKLVDAALDGQSDAFKRLVDCNQDKLFASMFRLLGCHQDAEEAVQEAFVRAFTRIESFNRQSKFSTWLYRIAFNNAISGRRKRRPRISLDQRHDELGRETVDERAESADERMLRDERIALIHTALDRLTDDHRAILVLREMDDLAYEEIAGILGISVGTVRSRLSRARGQLKEALRSLRAGVAEI